MRALLPQHRLLVGEVLLRALRLIAQLVDEVAAVVADGVLVVVAAVLEVADAFNGDERARRISRISRFLPASPVEIVSVVMHLPR